MSTEYDADVKKYAGKFNEGAVAGIVKHLGIALSSKDSSLVACSEERERVRIRDGFLKKKLERKESNDELDAAVMSICDKMKDTKQKSRVTFYYLLAEHFGQLDKFVK